MLRSWPTDESERRRADGGERGGVSSEPLPQQQNPREVGTPQSTHFRGRRCRRRSHLRHHNRNRRRRDNWLSRHGLATASTFRRRVGESGVPEGSQSVALDILCSWGSKPYRDRGQRTEGRSRAGSFGRGTDGGGGRAEGGGGGVGDCGVEAGCADLGVSTRCLATAVIAVRSGLWELVRGRWGRGVGSGLQ